MTADRVAEVWTLLVNPEDGAGLVARLRVVVRPGGGEVRAAPASSAIGPEVLESCRRAALLVLGAEQTRRTVDWELELEDGRTVELHGRSLTAAFAAALCAASAGVRAPDDVAITGDMDLSGALRPVGGLPTKARAAWARGMRVVAPAAGEEAAPSGGPIQLVADLPALRRALWPDAPGLATARTGGTERAARPRWRERWVWGVLAGLSAVGLVWMWPQASSPPPMVEPEVPPECPLDEPSGEKSTHLLRLEANGGSAPESSVGESPMDPTGAHKQSFLYIGPHPLPSDPATPPLPPRPLIVCVLLNDAPLVGREVHAGDELRLKVHIPLAGRLLVKSVSPSGDAVQLFPMDGEEDLVIGEQLVPWPAHDALLVVPPAGEERLVVRWRPFRNHPGFPLYPIFSLDSLDSRRQSPEGRTTVSYDLDLSGPLENSQSDFEEVTEEGSYAFNAMVRGRSHGSDGCVSVRWQGQDEVVVTLHLTQVATPRPALVTSALAGQPQEAAP